MIKKGKGLMVMTEKKKPKLNSVFSYLVDDLGYIFSSNDISCQEITNLVIVVVRIPKGEKDRGVFDKLKLALPEKLQLNTNADGIYCLWASPDEYWLLLSRGKKDEILELQSKLILVDNSSAYGILKLSGKKNNKLLKMLVNYNIDYALTPKKVVFTTMELAPIVLFKNNAIYLLVRNSFANYVANMLKDRAHRI